MLLFPCSFYIKPGLGSFASCLLAPAPVCLGTLDYSRLCLHPRGASQIPWGLEGTVLGGMVGDSGHSPPAEELFVGLDHFPFSCFPTSVSILWDAPMASQAQEANGKVGSHLAPVSCNCFRSPPAPTWTPTVPQVSQPWGGGSCPAQLRVATFFLLSSGKIHMLTSDQGHLKIHGTWTLLKARKCTMAGEERKSKGHLCCNLEERRGDCLSDVDHSLLLGIASGQCLCLGGLSYL